MKIVDNSGLTDQQIIDHLRTHPDFFKPIIDLTIVSSLLFPNFNIFAGFAVRNRTKVKTRIFLLTSKH